MSDLPATARRAVAALSLLAAVGCGSSAERTREIGQAPPPPPHPVRVQLPPGTPVRLRPADASGGAPHDAAAARTELTFVDGLWREALRQSPVLDVATGAEDTAAAQYEIELHLDRDGARLTTSLLHPGQAPVPLATAAVDGELGAALDAIATTTRQALGEHLDHQPRAAVAVYSADRTCVELTERGQRATRDGEWRSALEQLRRARERDPGCTITLAALARTLLALGSAEGNPKQIDEARRIAVEALSLEHRTAPTTEHRLAHIAIVARARAAGRPAEADLELLTLGDVARRERPHDPYVLLTRAVALNSLARFEESAPLLRSLAVRWPRSAEVAYHLTFAELASGRPEAALTAIDRAAQRLPDVYIVVPRSMALFHANQQTALRRYLDRQAAAADRRGGAQEHELRQMRAAHALLTDRSDEAAQIMLEDLDWLRQRPSKLELYAIDLAEIGEVLVRIGRAADLRTPLAALEEVHDLPPTVANVMVYLGGLIQVAESGERAEVAEAHLQSAGQTLWSSAVRAAAHRRRGELMDELRECVFQYQSTESPLARASLARALEAAGSHDSATEVIDKLRHRLLAFDLRRQRDHPLMRPASALAYLAIQQLGR